MHEDSTWVRGTEGLYEGVQIALSVVEEWYTSQLSALAARQPFPEPVIAHESVSPPPPTISQIQQTISLPPEIQIISSDPITDRKSTFIGHCALITSTDQVPLILSYLMQDKKIAKASHNIMFVSLLALRFLKANFDGGWQSLEM